VGGRASQQGYPLAPHDWDAFGCGPNASQSTLLSATPEVLSTSREGASGSTNHGPALGEISGHWDAVYEAMRREDESQQAAEH